MRLLLSLIVSFGLFEATNGFGATARELLASPSPVMRNVGAQLLRKSYVPPVRTNWDVLVGRLKPGMKESAVAGVFQPSNAVGTDSKGSTNQFIRTYRMDDLWVVYCSFTNSAPGKSESQLLEAKLQEAMVEIPVDPPANFTGEWLTYWVNGQLGYDCYYQNGQLEGVCMYFYSNGIRSIVISYHNGVPDGEDTGFYPSGQMQYKGQYQAGKEVGHWVWYNEDGSIRTQRDYDAKGK